MPTLGAVVAANMRAERARRRLDQSTLGEKLGWSRSKVSDVESGRRRIGADDLAPICRAFGITLAKLTDGADEEDLRVLGL